MFRKLLMIALVLTCVLSFVSSNKRDNVVSINEVRLEIGHDLKPVGDEIKEYVENGTLHKPPDCDCGENSDSCKFVGGKKVCSCQEGYITGPYEVCVETCNETMKCANGGSCLQHVCICLPGTSGPYCSNVDDCDRNICNIVDGTYCEYNQEKQRAVCRCNVIEHRFDDATRTCRNCQCTETFSPDPKAYTYCEYQQGQKVCTCGENYSFFPRRQICKKCECDENAKWCEFNNDTYFEICPCKDGYEKLSYGKCQKCDCGKHGLCRLSKSYFKKYDCICDSGYEQYNNTCVECSCGKYGKCIFDTEGKQVACECEPGYAEKSGKCEMCYCGENSNCTFHGKTKSCECSSGYKNFNGFCVDIDECKEHNRCNVSTICVNSLGSYKCVCASGYVPKYTEIEVLCTDIDECESSTACPEPNTECLNTLGSFVCTCKESFISRGGIDSRILCEKSTKNAIYTVALTTFFIALAIAVGLVIYVRQNLQSPSSSNAHELR